MQYRSFIQRLTPWLTAYLFVVSVGLPLQRVYCACMGEDWLTVSTEEHECHHGAEMAEVQDAHQHADNSCCHGEQTPHASACATHDCGSAEVILPQLDADFTFDAETFDLGLAAVLPPDAVTDWPVRPLVAKSTPIRGPSPPDLLSGRDLLVAHQTFLI